MIILHYRSFVESRAKWPLWLVFHRRTARFHRQIDESSRPMSGPASRPIAGRRLERPLPSSRMSNLTQIGHADRPTATTTILATTGTVQLHIAPLTPSVLRAQAWHRPIEDHTHRRNKLVEVIEIPNIAGQDRRPQQAGLVKDQRIVEEAAFMPLPFRQMAQPEQQAGKHAGASPGGGVGCMQPVRWNIFDRVCNHFQDRLRRGMRRIEPAEHVAELGKADRRVVTEPIGQKVIDDFGRASLQDIQIDARVEK